MTAAMKIDIILAVILLLCIWIGAKRGIFRAISGILGALAGLIGALKLSPMATPIIAKLIQPFFSGAVKSAAAASGISDSLQAVVSPDTQQSLTTLLDALHIPNSLFDNAVQAAAETGDKIASAAGTALANQLAPIVSFVLLFVIIQLATHLLCTLLSGNIPLVRTANALAGGALGALMGCIILFALCMGAKAYSPQNIGGFISIDAIEQSRIGSVIFQILQ